MKYRLLKDLPDLKAGYLFEEDCNGDYRSEDICLATGMRVLFDKRIIKERTDWFEEYTDPTELVLTDGTRVRVDKDDYEKIVCKHSWYKNNTGYIFRAIYVPETRKNISISMAREIMCILNKDWTEVQVDHIDGDPTNNTKENLRVVTPSQNGWNRKKPNIKNSSSKYKGVSWQQHANKWKSLLNKGGKGYHIGYFDSEIEAAAAYNEKAKEMFGEYANLNVFEEKTDFEVVLQWIRVRNGCCESEYHKNFEKGLAQQLIAFGIDVSKMRKES